MSRHCKACNLKETLKKKSDPDSYTTWKESSN